jgi:hypothetical protein
LQCIYIESKTQKKILKLLAVRKNIFALSNRTNVSQAQTGVTVPLSYTSRTIFTSNVMSANTADLAIQKSMYKDVVLN